MILFHPAIDLWLIGNAQTPLHLIIERQYNVNMTAILLLFFDICRFKRNPQDIPTSKLLKNLSILAYFGIGLVYKWLASSQFELALFISILETVLMLAMGYAALWTRGFEQRAVQTITALSGTGAVLYLLSIPLLIFPATVYEIVFTFFVIWSIAVVGHILRHSLSIAFGWGIGISFLFFILQTNLFAILFMPNQ